jgi:LmbE family N-acetylglucosaminyl deacetylase
MKMMDGRTTPLERAFELARSGEYAGVSEVRRQLKAEGYSDQQLEGRSLSRQLRELCEAAILAREEP